MFKRIVRTVLAYVKRPLKRARHLIRYIPFAFGASRYCPVCEKLSRKFGKYGLTSRDDALCMWCGALERDRLAWLFLSRKTDFFNGKQKSMLHIAPEHCFSSKFSDSIGDGYLTADIDGTRSMVQMDITNIQYPDNSFDVIYCSHVLEHVPDDRTAIRECFRILKLGGWAILLVPVSGDKTFQDLSVTDPAERVRLFGQDDHVRQYGADFVDLLKEAGFMVKETVASDFLSKEEVLRMGLGNRGAGAIFYCTKQL